METTLYRNRIYRDRYVEAVQYSRDNDREVFEWAPGKQHYEPGRPDRGHQHLHPGRSAPGRLPGCTGLSGWSMSWSRLPALPCCTAWSRCGFSSTTFRRV